MRRLPAEGFAPRAGEDAVRRAGQARLRERPAEAGASAAVGIAFINSVAALGAFVAPWLLGLIKDATGSFTYGLLALGIMVLCGAFIVLFLSHDSSLEHAPEGTMGHFA